MMLNLLFDPRREHLPSRPREFAAARAQGLSRLAAFYAATRQGLALIGPSTAARLFNRKKGVQDRPISNRRLSSIFTPLLTAQSENAVAHIGASGTKPGTIDALIVAYLDNDTFKGLADTTRATRRRILDAFRLCTTPGGRC